MFEEIQVASGTVLRHWESLDHIDLDESYTWVPEDASFIGELGKANPYGVYDLAADTGWVSVGTDHDTAAFAVETIRR